MQIGREKIHPTSCEHLWTFADTFVVVCILCAKIISWLAYAAYFAGCPCKSFKVNPVIEFFTGEIEVFIQWVSLVAFPVSQVYLKHVAFLIGHLWHKLISQPVFAWGTPKALESDLGKSLTLLTFLFTYLKAVVHQFSTEQHQIFSRNSFLYCEYLGSSI